ncbi:MAG: aminoacyl-histidine dipeptidase [Bacteroidaceae bacterium]|nr:aminoacyl-histidine dipeptidase [Bacteroidaceae bacterium]
MKITELRPALVWQCFDSLTQIPRPSGHTEAVADFLVDFGKRHGAEAWIDQGGNVIMTKGPTKGYENLQTVILQAHMDMVPQKTADSTHDFAKDPIRTIVDGEWVRADGTTLGADDGMGIAFAMAVVADESVEHGPIEVLITRDEETGMFGAAALRPGELKGSYLLNIDSETEGEITVGCAGGMDIEASMRYKGEKADTEGTKAFRISISGLLGGHSGIEINEGRANANKLMARTLFALAGTGLIRLCSWHGGNMRNAIPRNGDATVLVDEDDVRKFNAMVRKCERTFNDEYKDIEEDHITLTVEPVTTPRMAIPEEIGMNLINAVMAAHDGVLRYIPTIPSIVETSVNLSIVNIEKGKAQVIMLARSATDSMKQFLCNELVACFSMAGMKVRLRGGYSGWQPNTSSPFVAMMADIYKRMYGEEAKILVVHAGLECGIIGPKYPHLDMASIGPTLRSPHTPNERCHIPSVEKSYNYVLEVLKNIPHA